MAPIAVVVFGVTVGAIPMVREPMVMSMAMAAAKMVMAAERMVVAKWMVVVTRGTR